MKEGIGLARIMGIHLSEDVDSTKKNSFSVSGADINFKVAPTVAKNITLQALMKGKNTGEGTQTKSLENISELLNPDVESFDQSVECAHQIINSDNMTSKKFDILEENYYFESSNDIAKLKFGRVKYSENSVNFDDEAHYFSDEDIDNFTIDNNCEICSDAKPPDSADIERTIMKKHKNDNIPKLPFEEQLIIPCACNKMYHRKCAKYNIIKEQCTSCIKCKAVYMIRFINVETKSKLLKIAPVIFLIIDIILMFGFLGLIIYGFFGPKSVSIVFIILLVLNILFLIVLGIFKYKTNFYKKYNNFEVLCKMREASQISIDHIKAFSEYLEALTSIQILIPRINLYFDEIKKKQKDRTVRHHTFDMQRYFIESHIVPDINDNLCLDNSKKEEEENAHVSNSSLQSQEKKIPIKEPEIKSQYVSKINEHSVGSQLEINNMITKYVFPEPNKIQFNNNLQKQNKYFIMYFFLCIVQINSKQILIKIIESIFKKKIQYYVMQMINL